MSNFMTQGTGIIVFANQFPFTNGGGVNSYLIRSSLDKKDTTFTIKEFWKQGNAITLKEKGTTWYINGTLEIYNQKNKDGTFTPYQYIKALEMKLVVDEATPEEDTPYKYMEEVK